MSSNDNKQSKFFQTDRRHETREDSDDRRLYPRAKWNLIIIGIVVAATVAAIAFAIGFLSR